MPLLDAVEVTRSAFMRGFYGQAVSSREVPAEACDNYWRIPAGTTETRCFIDRHSGEMRIASQSVGMWAYLEREANRRSISVIEMHDIEEEAGREIERLGITDEFLDFVTQSSLPPQKLALQS